MKAGLGVTVRTVEMMNQELMVLGTADGLPVLPDTQYFLCKRLQEGNTLADAIFNVVASGHYYRGALLSGASASDDNSTSEGDAALKNALFMLFRTLHTFIRVWRSSRTPSRLCPFFYSLLIILLRDYSHSLVFLLSLFLAPSKVLYFMKSCFLFFK